MTVNQLMTKVLAVRTFVAVVIAAAVLTPSAAWAGGTSIICHAPRSLPCQTDRPGGGQGLYFDGGEVRVTVDLRDAPGRVMDAGVLHNTNMTTCGVKGISEGEGPRTFTCSLPNGFLIAEADTVPQPEWAGTVEISMSW